MTMIYIPFKKFFREKAISGVKVVTRRYRKYGEVGDTFPIRGEKVTKVFTLTNVYRERIGDTTGDEAKKEGCESLIHFRHEWRKIHPRIGWRANNFVWVHRWD